jgi:hypothetical protein
LVLVVCTWTRAIAGPPAGASSGGTSVQAPSSGRARNSSTTVSSAANAVTARSNEMEPSAVAPKFTSPLAARPTLAWPSSNEMFIGPSHPKPSQRGPLLPSSD